MKKVLMIASVPSMIGQFNMNNIELLQSMGYKVDVACNFNDRSVWTAERVQKFEKDLEDLNIDRHQIDFSRSMYRIDNHVKSYKQTVKLLQENNYEFIHCHTPIGGAISRIAAHKTNTKVIYTAHGFHFFKGAPIMNWILFYPIEKFLAKWTDVLITINTEDFERAKKKFKAKKIEYVPGVGYDEGKVSKNPNIPELRNKFNIPQDATVLLTVGELNKNKNQQIVIEAMSKIQDDNIHYLLCGVGVLKEKLEQRAKELNIGDRVHFLGFRNDLADIYGLSDIYLCPSIREGLNVSIMEAMANGLPCIVSDIRGNRDLIENGGVLFRNNNVYENICAIKKVLSSNYSNMSKYNKERIINFSSKYVNEKMYAVFEKV